MLRENESELLLAFAKFLEKRDARNDHDYDEEESVERKGNRIHFYSSVTQQAVLRLNMLLRDIEEENKILQIRLGLDELPPIHLHINSFGGSYFAGISVAKVIAELDSPVHSHIEGCCASAATFFSVISDYRTIGSNSFICIHDVHSSFHGRYLEWVDESENMDKLQQNMLSIYEEHTQLSRKQLEELMKRDLWFTPEEALEKGLVDEIYP